LAWAIPHNPKTIAKAKQNNRDFFIFILL